MPALYTATVTSIGGRSGSSQSDDGKLDLSLSTPKALGGDDGAGTNPEQLFGAGYSACFIGAMQYIAQQEAINLPNAPEVVAKVGIGPNEAGAGFAISADLTVKVEGMDKKSLEDLANKAHQVCPYSNATRGNMDVIIHIA